MPHEWVSLMELLGDAARLVPEKFVLVHTEPVLMPDMIRIVMLEQVPGQGTLVVSGAPSGDSTSMVSSRLPLITKSGRTNPSEWIMVGRTAEADVMINDFSVSSEHCRLREERRGSWPIEDLGSRNGTCLDGEQLEPGQEVPLPSGTLLQLGRITMTFLMPPELLAMLNESMNA